MVASVRDQTPVNGGTGNITEFPYTRVPDLGYNGH